MLFTHRSQCGVMFEHPLWLQGVMDKVMRIFKAASLPVRCEGVNVNVV